MLVLAFGLSVALRVGVRWYRHLLQFGPRRTSAVIRQRVFLGAVPVALLAALAVILDRGAARAVRENAAYFLLFLGLGATWLVATARVTALLGISLQDDAIERRNPAAVVATAGALVGGMTTYAFANQGEGETIWTTIGPALLASLACWSLWAVHQLVSTAADAISIDRDLASGWRFAGMTIATSLIVGRAVAGNYESAAKTCEDFLRCAWPALPLVALAGYAQLALHPTNQPPRRDLLRSGILPAFSYVSLGVLDLAWWGRA
jgi:uncharacterized membrane protein YjfL (UPF0719 family)